MPILAADDEIHSTLAQLDLNLLLTLDALLEARNVTGTAARFGVTQSAMSHRLARLRDYFDDSLLVLSGDELVLTRRAETIQGPLRDALKELRNAVSEEATFDPAHAQRCFVIAAADLTEVVMLPGMLSYLGEVAPGVSVRMAGRREVRGDALMRGRVDLAIGPGAGTVPGVVIEETGGIRQRKLLDEGFAVLVRRGHPRIKGSLSMQRYLAESHILVAPHGQPGSVVDTRLAEQGKRRRVAVQVAHFLSAPFLVAQTDYIVTCPTSLADSVKDTLGLRAFKPPLSLPQTAIFLYWHERSHKDPGHRWLREEILANADRLRR